MNGLNVEGIVSNVTYIILMRLGDGELVEIRGSDRHRWKDAEKEMWWWFE